MIWQALKKENALDEYSVVGLLGSDPSKRQIQRIKGFSNEVILFLDNDVAGRSGRDKLVKFLLKSVLLSGIVYPAEFENSDPDDVVRKGFSVVELARSSELLTI
jgi:DNA primase